MLQIQAPANTFIGSSENTIQIRAFPDSDIPTPNSGYQLFTQGKFLFIKDNLQSQNKKKLLVLI